MTKDEVNKILLSIITKNFRVEASQFLWDQPIEVMNKDFNSLGYLVFLEQLVSNQFKVNIPLLENISAEIHTVNDISDLIMKEIKIQC